MHGLLQRGDRIVQVRVVGHASKFAIGVVGHHDVRLLVSGNAEWSALLSVNGLFKFLSQLEHHGGSSLSNSSVGVNRKVVESSLWRHAGGPPPWSSAV